MPVLISSATVRVALAKCLIPFSWFSKLLGHFEQGDAVMVCANRTIMMAVTAEENFMIVRRVVVGRDDSYKKSGM